MDSGVSARLNYLSLSLPPKTEKMKKAIITGITGQDGAYLSQLLLDKGYKVFGAYRRTSSQNFWRIDYLEIRDHPNLILVEHDLIDAASTIRMISEIRPDEYVTRKITRAVARIYYGKQKILKLGDINTKIDWGYAKDYVEFSHKIMQQKKPDFFIIASGKKHSVLEFAKKSFDYVGLDYKKHIKIEKRLFRPSKTVSLVGNTNKAKKILLILIPMFVFFDQLSKQWALKNIFYDQTIIEINKYLNFIPVWNKGISFGMLSDLMNINFFMVIVTITISLFLVLWFLRTTNKNLSISLAFIVSGAIGNLIDRLNYKAVVDFIDIHIGNLHWPTFNLADSYITIGAFIYIHTIFTSQKNNIA